MMRRAFSVLEYSFNIYLSFCAGGHTAPPLPPAAKYAARRLILKKPAEAGFSYCS